MVGAGNVWLGLAVAVFVEVGLDVMVNIVVGVTTPLF